VLGVDNPCHGAEVGAQCVECVLEVVAEGFLAVSAAKEMVAIWVKGLVAVDAWCRWDGDGKVSCCWSLLAS
jgi:hypothetical protein